MNLRKLKKHLRENDCVLYREGGNHSIWRNLESGQSTAVPRHKEIGKGLVVDICDDLGIPSPFSKKK